MQVIPERSLTAPQAIRAFRMQSQQDAARLQAAGGGGQDFAATLQGLRQGPASMAGPGTPTGHTLSAQLQRLDTDQDGRITPLELGAAVPGMRPPGPAHSR